MTGELAKALAAFQAEMPTVTKGKTAEVPTKAGGKYTYTYADLASVTAAALPLLSKNGLAFTTTPEPHGTGFVLTGRLLHISGEEVHGSLPLIGGGPQEVGSALTYARRYLLGCLTGIVTEDDDDGAKAQKATQATRTRPSAPPTDEWSTTPPNPAHAARVDLGNWITEHGLDPQEAVDRWAADHNNQHLRDATDADGIRALQATWESEIAAQMGATP